MLVPSAVTQRLKSWLMTLWHRLYASMFKQRSLGFEENVTIHFKVLFTLKIQRSSITCSQIFQDTTPTTGALEPLLLHRSIQSEVFRCSIRWQQRALVWGMGLMKHRRSFPGILSSCAFIYWCIYSCMFWYVTQEHTACWAPKVWESE